MYINSHGGQSVRQRKGGTATISCVWLFQRRRYDDNSESEEYWKSVSSCVDVAPDKNRWQPLDLMTIIRTARDSIARDEGPNPRQITIKRWLLGAKQGVSHQHSWTNTRTVEKRWTHCCWARCRPLLYLSDDVVPTTFQTAFARQHVE